MRSLLTAAALTAVCLIMSGCCFNIGGPCKTCTTGCDSGGFRVGQGGGRLIGALNRCGSDCQGCDSCAAKEKAPECGNCGSCDTCRRGFSLPKLTVRYNKRGCDGNCGGGCGGACETKVATASPCQGDCNGGCQDGSCWSGGKGRALIQNVAGFRVRGCGRGCGGASCGDAGCGQQVADGCGAACGGARCGNPGCGLLSRGVRGRFGSRLGGQCGGPGYGAQNVSPVPYPYYTLRGPRDFLMDNPPTIGR